MLLKVQYKRKTDWNGRVVAFFVSVENHPLKSFHFLSVLKGEGKGHMGIERRDLLHFNAHVCRSSKSCRPASVTIQMMHLLAASFDFYVLLLTEYDMLVWFVMIP